MVMPNRHSGHQDAPLDEPHPVAKVDVAVRRQDRIEPPRSLDRLAAVRAVPAAKGLEMNNTLNRACRRL
jgi:hypothetical protein